MKSGVNETQLYFDHDADIGIIGRGNSVEDCFSNIARVMFSLMSDIENVHAIQIITIEFEEANLELALVTWLNLLLAKSQELHIIFGDFRLRREGNIWKATVSGEPWRGNMQRGMEVKAATLTMLSVKKTSHSWEARCVVNV